MIDDQVGVDGVYKLVIADFVLIGDRNEKYFQREEEVEFVFLIQNCGSLDARNVFVSIKAKENTIATDIQIFYSLETINPEEFKPVRGRFSSDRQARLISLEIELTANDKKYSKDLYFYFGEEYKNNDQLLSSGCESPAFVLAFEEIPAPVLPDKEVFIEPVVITDRQETIIETDRGLMPRDSRKTARMVYGSAAMAALGTSAYFYNSANQKYQEYAGATFDATRLHNQITRDDLIWQTALAVSVPLIIMTGIKHFQHRKHNKSYVISPIPTQNGMVLSFKKNL